MIQQVTDKKTKAAYTEIICDLCRKPCRKSRVSGQTSDAASAEANRLAIEAGWVEHWQESRTATGRPKRRMSWIIQMCCPKCQKAGKKAVADA